MQVEMKQKAATKRLKEEKKTKQAEGSQLLDLLKKDGESDSNKRIQ